MGYLSHFIVYVLAMLSVIGIAMFVYKKFNVSGYNSKKVGALKIEDVLSLSPRKSLYVINANGEKFLIASDMERTTLISKLETNSNTQRANSQNTVNIQEFIRNEDVLTSGEKQPVMKNLAKKLGREVR